MSKQMKKKKKAGGGGNLSDEGIGEQAPEKEKKKFNIMDMFKGCLGTKKNEPNRKNRTVK